MRYNTILIGAILVSFLLMGTAQAGTLSGFSEITINTGTKHNTNSGKYWTLIWTETGKMYEDFTAYIEPQDFKNLAGTESKQALTIQSSGTDNSCDYNMVGDPNRETVFNAVIVELSVPPWTCGTWGCTLDGTQTQWVIDNCWKGTYTWRNGIVWDDLICYKPTKQLGLIGKTTDEEITFETNFVAYPEGKNTETATLSNKDTGAGKVTVLGDNTVIEWQGSLSSGKSCPISNNFMVAHSNSFPGGWQLIDENNYNLYEFFAKVQFEDALLDYVNGYKTKQQTEDSWNNLAIFAVKEFKIPNNIVYKNPNYVGGSIEIELEYLIFYPQFRFIIDADYLEVNIQTADPDIIGVQISDFEEGQPNPEPLKVTVKNQANNGGDIYTRVIDCYGGFKDGSPQTHGFGPGETKILTFPMYCGSTAPEPTFSGGCTVEAKNFILPGGTQIIDTYPFTVSCQSAKDCIPGNKWCEGDKIVECDSTGTGWYTIEICVPPEECKYIAEEPVCKDPNAPECKTNEDCPNGYECIIDPIFGNYCKKMEFAFSFAGYEWYLLIGILALSTFMGWFFGRDLITLILGAALGAIAVIIMIVVVTFVDITFGWLIWLLSFAGITLETSWLYIIMGVPAMLVIFLILLNFRRSHG
jgi:hypothetical protein